MMIINTKTSEDYIEVVSWAINQGMMWRNGDRSFYENYIWKEYGPETCIEIEDERLTYCSLEYVINNYETEILDMTQFRKHLIDKFAKKFDLR